MKKFFASAVAFLVCCAISVTAFAAPYYNYSFHRGFVTAEPQAYTPYKVIDSVTMGLFDGTNGTKLNKPEDMASSTVNGDIAIADTGNNRIVILNVKYEQKQILCQPTVITETKPVLDENGEHMLDENGNKMYQAVVTDLTGFLLNGVRYKVNAPEGVTFDSHGRLYVCDTGNGRIFRFVLDENGKYQCDKLFNKPKGLDELLSSEGDGTEGLIPEDGSTPAPETTGEETPEDTPEDTPEETPEEGEEGSDQGGDGEQGDNSTDNNTDSDQPQTDNATTNNQYKPIKVAISDSGTMYVVSKGNHKGLIELSSDGAFTKFTGATKVKQTLSQLLNRILTDDQKKGTTLNLSTEYSNICLDADGMIYGTINSIEGSDLHSHFSSKSEIGAAIKRISPIGDDILKRNDVYPPSGDLGYDITRENFSAMVDIAVASDGIYHALDNNKGRIFTYNVEGELLFIFGAKGNVNGAFTDPVAINLFTFAAVEDGIIAEDDPDADTYKQMIIAVLDSSTGQITIFKPTEYGKLIRSATMSQQTRQYDRAIEQWNEVLDQASNSRLAFNGLGRIQYVRGEYEDACDNFMKAYNNAEYAEAFAKLRNQKLEVAMPWIMTVIVIIVIAFVVKAIVTKLRHFIKTGGRSDE